MTTLREHLDQEGITADQPSDDVVIPTYNPLQLLELQAAFASMVQANPDLTKLVNAYGPVIFATVLFTMSEDYQIDPNDPDSLVAGNSVLEAEAKAIGVLRGVASAFAALEDEVAVEPAESEIDADTEIEAV